VVGYFNGQKAKFPETEENISFSVNEVPCFGCTVFSEMRYLKALEIVKEIKSSRN
jgi:hypothetical protein